MRVLVIGGTEFISLHLVRALLRGGHEVAALNRGRHAERLPAGVRAIVADRKDHAAVRQALRGERVDALVDIAYAPTTGEDVEAVLAALDGRLGHALFVSTGRVYDHALPIPWDETTPRNLYWGARFGAVIETKHGRHVQFDSIDCLTRYTAKNGAAVSRVWVVDADEPGTLIAYEAAVIEESATLRPPMGRLIAHGR